MKMTRQEKINFLNYLKNLVERMTGAENVYDNYINVIKRIKKDLKNAN